MKVIDIDALKHFYKRITEKVNRAEAYMHDVLKMQGYNEAEREMYFHCQNYMTDIKASPKTFSDKEQITRLPAIGVTGDPWRTFYGYYNLVDASLLDISNMDRLHYMFEDCYALKKAPVADTSRIKSFRGMFSNCRELEEVPEYDCSSLIETWAMFAGCHKLNKAPMLDIARCTDHSLFQMFFECKALHCVPVYDTATFTDFRAAFEYSGIITGPNWDLSNADSIQEMYANCPELVSVPALNCPEATNVQWVFAGSPKLQRVESIDFTSATDTTEIVAECPSLEYMLIIGLGTAAGLTRADLCGTPQWGSNKNYDGEASLIASLVENSFDRAAAGYPVCTITLHPSVLARLTDEHRARITAKGYTLVTIG